jgi:hypothetical protein
LGAFAPKYIIRLYSPGSQLLVIECNAKEMYRVFQLLAIFIFGINKTINAWDYQTQFNEPAWICKDLYNAVI